VNPQDVLVTLDRAGGRFGQLLQQSPDWASRARGVAEVLRDCWPGAVLYACLLAHDGHRHLAVLDAEGQPSDDWQQRLRPAAPAGAEWGARWSDQLGEGGRPAIIQPVSEAEGGHSLVALLPGAQAGPDEVSLARMFLTGFARSLSLHLDLACRTAEGQNLREMLAELETLANVGELSGPLAHEFTNFLNVLLLQVTILEYQLPEAHRADLTEIRRQGNLATETVNRFHQYRRGHAMVPRAVDLNHVVAEVAAEMVEKPPVARTLRVLTGPGAAEPGSSTELTVTLSAAMDLPAVRGAATDVRRLVRFVLGNAVRAVARGGGQVFVTTEARGGIARLTVEDNGPGLSSDAVLHLFDPAHPNREGVDVLELAACRSLMRRLGGALRAEARPGGGICVRGIFGEEPAS
jgi:signal transduction histidine kinase